ncbi:MAG: hypothetical protein JF616_01950 [Fibrobacteres bacterium]|nr:hypothetical protein [Fibrobacterota bacterium]
MDATSVAVALAALRARLSALEENPTAGEAAEFLARSEAMDELELGVSLPLASLGSAPEAVGEAEAAGGLEVAEEPNAIGDLADLRRRAESLLARWEALDDSLFQGLRLALREARDPGAAFRGMLATYLPSRAFEGIRISPGYDARDAFLSGLLLAEPIPAPVHPLEPGMVQLQNTPVRILLELIEKSALAPSDTFYDIGSGLGQVPLTVHLLTGARAIGIEREPAYVGYARDLAAAFGLPAVRFQRVDARDADYSDASALFLYTPFRGPMLEAVLDRIRGQCRAGARMFTYGPASVEIARHDWLKPLWPPPPDGLGGFALA